MRNLLSEVFNKRRAQVTDSRSEYLTILRRMDSPKPGDAAKLLTAMTNMGLSEAEVQADAEIVRRVVELESILAKSDEMQTERNRLSDLAWGVREKLEAAMKALQDEYAAAMQPVHALDAHLGAAMHYRNEVNQLRAARPDLFTGEGNRPAAPAAVELPEPVRISAGNTTPAHTPPV